MLKFRTMVDGADAELDAISSLNESDGVLFKIRSDPRVTRSGRFLRRHSLDELPQLWNVVRGEMSSSGPRPPLPSEVEQYETDAHRRLLVKPGLTGLWQVSGRSELTWEDSVRLDLYYVENWSPALDVQILWRTIGAVIRGRGAYCQRPAATQHPAPLGRLAHRFDGNFQGRAQVPRVLEEVGQLPRHASRSPLRRLVHPVRGRCRADRRTSGYPRCRSG